MKIKTLFLKAFGPFTDRKLDFANGTANLHVIYGPNEAGKSSALRAMTDLRFDIPNKSTDCFVHAFNDMSIAATLIDENGVEISVHRRKGYNKTLSMADDNGNSLRDTPVSPDIALALMAGLDRKQFESMYALDHQRLREGGKSLLDGDGEVGSSLFEASSGTTNIKELLEALQADAKKYYASRGHGAILNAARKQLDDQKKALKEAQTKPKTWKELDSNHQKSKDDLSAANEALAALRKTDAELTELRTVQPLLKQHDDTAIELDAFINVPLLPESARERRLSAEQSYAAAQEAADTANQTIITCKAALDSLIIELLLINHESTINNLITDAAAVRRNASTQAETQATYENQVEHLKTAAKCISNTATLESLLEKIPSAADKAVIHGKVEQFKELERDLRSEQKQLVVLEQKLASLSVDSGAAPDPSLMKSISQTVREAQSVGDIHSRIAALDQDIRSSIKSLDTLLHDIGSTSVDELMTSRPLLPGEIDATESTLKGIDEKIAELESSSSVINRDLKIQQQKLTTHAAEGEIATLRTLAAIREHRNEGWERIKQAYVVGDASPDFLVRDYDAETSLPKAFENALGEADRQADILRANADRAAAIAETEKRIAEMSEALPVIEADITNWQNKKTEALNSWGIMLTNAKLPQHSPSILREWLQQRNNCLDAHNRLQELKQQHAELLKIALAHTTVLAEKLKLAKEPTTEPHLLPALIIQAQDWLEAMTKRVAQQEASRAALNSLQSEIQDLKPHIESLIKLLDDSQASLNAWHSRLMLPENSPPSALTARLVELDSLATENSKIAVLNLQLTKARALSDKVHTDALAVAQLLGEPIVTHDMDFTDRLKSRLDASKTNAREKTEQDRLRTSAEASLYKATKTIKMAKQSLSDLCLAASITDPAYLPEVEANSSERIRLQTQLSALTSHLKQASHSSIDDLRLRLASKSTADLDEAKERCTNEINELQSALEEKREAEQAARGALEQIDASGKAAKARETMESALADYRAALKPWAQLRLAELLLETALASFKERAQGPMTQKASEYFCLSTGNRYKRLFINDDNKKPVLMAERSDGAFISVESMSEGTADQLYLALRLSALDMKNDGRFQMPLILDDVLITSDDERSANILKALSQFAVNNQVLVFTHHQHLVDLATNTLPAHVLATHTL